MVGQMVRLGFVRARGGPVSQAHGSDKELGMVRRGLGMADQG